VRIIARKTFKEFWDKHRDAKAPLEVFSMKSNKLHGKHLKISKRDTRMQVF
jgi:mRNA-degrading endonuclease HigB of HigAB toxin-antitoxin module